MKDITKPTRAPNRRNALGNSIWDYSLGMRIESRYVFDGEACASSNGWQQYDTRQDAWYFGVWVHVERRLTVTFAEGDLTVVHCEDDAHLAAELQSMAEFYGEPPPAFITIDDDGAVTQYIDERPEVTQ